LTGSIPKGITANEILGMLSVAKEKGAKVVIDSRSVALSDILSIKPWLIKPNQGEIEAYVGKSIENIDSAAKVARELFSLGIENVMISLGEGGAVLASESGVFYAKAPFVKVLSTVGAGDSAIGGFLDGFLRGDSSECCLARAVAYGTAACMREGTRPPLPEDVSNILAQTELVMIP
jgi:1-phosphofructokinase family hexose kinase